jgi:hypothetical protein
MDFLESSPSIVVVQPKKQIAGGQFENLLAEVSEKGTVPGDISMGCEVAACFVVAAVVAGIVAAGSVE